MDNDHVTAARQAIDSAGGPNKVSLQLFGTTKKQSRVCNWKVRGVPARYCLAMAKLSGVPAELLCPPTDIQI